MTDATRQRLFGFDSAFAHPATGILLAAVGVMLLVGLVTILLVSRHLDAERRKELWQRYIGWLVFVPVVAGSILAGAFWAILIVALLSILCYREYARATGLFREKLRNGLCELPVWKGYADPENFCVFGLLHAQYAPLDRFKRLSFQEVKLLTGFGKEGVAFRDSLVRFQRFQIDRTYSNGCAGVPARWLDHEGRSSGVLFWKNQASDQRDGARDQDGGHWQLPAAPEIIGVFSQIK